MVIRRTATFKKLYRKLPGKTQTQFEERLRLFAKEPGHPMLRVHPLKGTFSGYWSLNVSGDVRAIFHQEGEVVTFVLIGTHSQLYV